MLFIVVVLFSGVPTAPLSSLEVEELPVVMGGYPGCDGEVLSGGKL